MQGWKVIALREGDKARVQEESSFENLGAAYCVIYPTRALAESAALLLASEAADFDREGLSFRAVQTTDRDLFLPKLQDLERRADDLAREIGLMVAVIGPYSFSQSMRYRLEATQVEAERMATDLFFVSQDYAQGSDSIWSLAERIAFDAFSRVTEHGTGAALLEKLDKKAALSAAGFEPSEENMDVFTLALERAHAFETYRAVENDT